MAGGHSLLTPALHHVWPPWVRTNSLHVSRSFPRGSGQAAHLGAMQSAAARLLVQVALWSSGASRHPHLGHRADGRGDAHTSRPYDMTHGISLAGAPSCSGKQLRGRPGDVVTLQGGHLSSCIITRKRGKKSWGATSSPPRSSREGKFDLV